MDRMIATTLQSRPLTHARLKYLAALAQTSEDHVSRLGLALSIASGPADADWEPSRMQSESGLVDEINEKHLRGRTLFKDDLADIQNSLKRLLSYAGQKKTFDLFDHEQMNIFMESLDQRYFAEIPFKDKLADANKKIIELSNEQLETYDMMYDPVNARLAVSGGAGTGKTILATHLAYKCATAQPKNGSTYIP